MEKTIIIDGKSVTFKKTGGTMLAYRRQTGREFYTDLASFLKCAKTDDEGNIIYNSNGIPKIDMENFSIDYMYDILHCMARAADKSVPADMLEWLDGFEEFPVIQIFIDVLPLLNAEMGISRKN